MNHTENNCKTWTPCEDVLENFLQKNFAVVVLNCPININVDHRHVLNLWTHAKVRVTVDGGTKKWLSWLQAHDCEELDIYAPDLITGDMDSLPAEILRYFEQKQSKIIKTPDQDETDFTKSLIELQKYCDTKGIEIDTIFVFADTSGRFDHIMGNINTLFKAATFMEDKRIYQIASNSITFLLTPGNHKISIPENLRKEKEWCALIPIGAPCVLSSTGLKWDLNETQLAFGGMISTSNTYSGEPFVTVKTEGFVTWSMGIEAIL